jgi:malonyl-CoA O-methyltransferase
MSKLSAPIDLQLVRRLFSDEARCHKIAESDFLRREIATRMMDKLEFVNIAPQCLLDAGCGEGADLAQLQKKFPQAQMIGVDASPTMLANAAQNQAAAMNSLQRVLTKWLPSNVLSGKQTQWVNADFTQLPQAAQSVDILWSNLALHWHPQPDFIFAEWRRVLRTEGLVMFSCFGPDTLLELRSAFQGIDEAAHVLPFVDMHDYGDMLVNAGFATPVMDMEKLTLTYQTVDKLFDDVRALGGNPLQTRRRGLLGRVAYQSLCAALEKQRNADGRIPLTFEIIYGHAFKPIPTKLASGESIIRFEPNKKKS